MIRILKDILFSLYLLISSIIFSVLITLNISPLLYSFFLNFKGLSSVNNLSKNQIMNDYNNIIHYLNSPYETTLKFENFKMSPTGEYHFLEVKNIFTSVYLAALACLIIGIILFILLKKLKFKIYLNAFNLFFYEVLIICSLILLGFYFNFSKVFTLFHKVFFNNDYWIFDPKKDPIINVLPESYFLFLATVVILLVLLFSIISKVFYSFKKSL
ncbi:TPA: TIGR01906 family membrane protein [Clostridium perfringens]